MKTALVLGSSGFIGGHLVKYLKDSGFWVCGVDIKKQEYDHMKPSKFILGDLRDPYFVKKVINKRFDEVYQLAADMGGAGYINTGNNDADVMGNSVLMNVNILKQSHKVGISGIFYSSTACVYPEYNQTDAESIDCRESSVYPAQPDTEYGWEKIFSERLYLSYNKNYGMKNKIARYHNVFGPFCIWDGGKEKAPAALCRKVIKSTDSIEIWGNGEQHRSFLYIDECIKATVDFYRQDKFFEPINIGSEKNISINELVDILCDIAKKNLNKIYVPGPIGVKARTSNNELFHNVMGYKVKENLRDGLETTYRWIEEQIGI